MGFFFNKSKTNDQQIINEAPKFRADEAEFDALILKIRSVCGIDLEVKRSTIKPKLIKFCEQNGLENFGILSAKVDLNPQIRQELFDLITVCETYFYRELKQLQEVINHLRRYPAARRLLCAPCSSGEEVYSLLMLANEAGIKDLKITGIDLNESIIDKARAGVYSKRSLYNLDDALVRRYFRELSADEFAIRSELLAAPSFRVCNVFGREFAALGSFDVILSRNMMIYFNEEFKYKLIDIFHRQLSEGGLFFAGHADLVPAHDGFEKIYSAQTNYYQKL